MMKTIRFLLLLISFNGIAQTQENIQGKIDSLFSNYNNQTSGVAVAVVKNSKTIFSKGYGMANLEYDIPITPQTIFHVASVSKQFTAFAIYLLENQGKISFDDDVRKYIPELPNFEKSIRIKHLLYHTSGLKDQWALLTLAGWRLDDVITTEQILKLISQQKELNFQTGSQFSYSNTGYTLLAEIVKRVSGQTFAEFTERHIFSPLEMNNTQFYDNHERIVKNRAYSYYKENEVFKKRKLNYANVGATSLFTTAEDLAKWAINFEHPRVGNAKLIKKFNEVAKLDNGKPAILGFFTGENVYHAKGQFYRDYRGTPIFNHTGRDAGFRAYLGRLPDKNLSIIVLGNDQALNSIDEGLKIIEFYLKDDLKPEIINSPQGKKSNSKKEFNTDLTSFEGDYYNAELTTAYHLKVKNDELIMSHRRLSDIILTQKAEDTFSGINTFEFEIVFLRQNQKIIGFKISNFGAKNVVFLKKIDPKLE